MIVKDLARAALCVVVVFPAMVALNVLTAIEKRLPQPAGHGPQRRDEF